MEDQRFLALALGGEVGELQNLIKKEWRGFFDVKGYKSKVADELSDIRIYLELLAVAFEVNLDQACEMKVKKLCRRWPKFRIALEDAQLIKKQKRRSRR